MAQLAGKGEPFEMALEMVANPLKMPTMQTRFSASTVVIWTLLLGLGACGDDAGPIDEDAGMDAGDDAGFDGGVDAGEDAGFDAGMDAGDDAGFDAGMDAGDDAGMDAGPMFLEDYPLMAVHPEGGAYDEAGHAFYMGSLEHGTVRRVDAMTGEDTEFFVGEPTGAWWTLGMDVDEMRRHLWVCAAEDLRGGDTDEEFHGEIWAFDLDSGERFVRVRFPADNSICADVAVHSDGTAYVANREAGVIYRMTAEEDTLTVFLEDDILGMPGIGQNALVLDEDLGLLFSLKYVPSALVRIPLDGSGRVRNVNIDGDFSDLSPVGSGADGMARLADGTILVAFTSEITQLVPSTADWMNARADDRDVPSGATDVIATPGGAYVLNGQAVRFALGVPDVDDEPFVLAPVPRFD